MVEIRIKVIGVGGAGVNTVNRLKVQGLSKVEVLAVNTDVQSLEASSLADKIQIGTKLTKGCGSGGNIEIGRMAANESRQDIAKAMEGIDLVFITAGCGGGTGTGASPTIAKLAREAGVTAIAVVTLPFLFEGQKRMAAAEEGAALLEDEADTVVVIPNQKLFEAATEGIPLEEAFRKADDVLIKVIASITDLITMPGLINLDFSNVRAVVTRGGRGFFGFGEASGEDRRSKVVENTFSSSLLEEVDIKTARSCLINIYGSGNLSFKDVNSIMGIISDKLGSSANTVFGVTTDPGLKDTLRLTVIATGMKKQPKPVTASKNWPSTFDYREELDIPSFLRKKE